ncbi:hypothetical protein [Wolbachia endosymbiont of Howardula sp.]|uniref:hypothetical protein n=1 Tax=Wolbachia endosymbiont of Howardula sp. TaxID=2916816 RepID=UPI00217D3E9E|nr:hypothetical protein [Wolbachia endosymbiont of Howardula sp.]UWI83052.1 hypothetical protein MC061_01955 [Wolbachia endosymbiont of Howardula sp.]
MSPIGKAKTASKNNPTHRKKAQQKLHNNQPVRPIRYIDRDCRLNYISAQYDDGSLVKDQRSGDPIKWNSL